MPGDGDIRTPGAGPFPLVGFAPADDAFSEPARRFGVEPRANQQLPQDRFAGDVQVDLGRLVLDAHLDVMTGERHVDRHAIDRPLRGLGVQQRQDGDVDRCIGDRSQLRHIFAAAAQLRIGANQLQNADDDDGEDRRCPERGDNRDASITRRSQLRHLL
jgi:hypothetical protein